MSREWPDDFEAESPRNCRAQLLQLTWGRPAPEDQAEIAGNLIHDEDPPELEIEEIASILFSLSFSGHETTTGLIGNLVRHSLVDRRRWNDVVAHPDLIGGAVDETLRFDTSVPA
jgi:cytochrome P450